MRDNNLEYLGNYGIVIRWALKHYVLPRGDMELLLYLNTLKFFTRPQFEDGELLYGWDKDRFYRLVKDGWLKKVYQGYAQGGESNKYAVTSKTIRMLRRIDRLLDGKEQFPMTKNMPGKRYSDKVLRNCIKKRYEDG